MDARGVAECDGATTQEARILRPDVPTDAELLDAGEHLVLVEKSQLSRVDRCTGALTSLAEANEIVSVTSHGGFLYFVAVDEMWFYAWLRRVPLAGGEVEELGDIGTTRIVGSERGVFARDYVAAEEWTLRDVTEGDSDEVLVTFQIYPESYSSKLLGASEAGIYLWESYDSGKPLPLRVWPYEGSDWLELGGTEGAAPYFDVRGDAVFVKREDGPANDIVRVPMTGGEPVVVVSSGAWDAGFGLTAIEGTDDAVCWLQHERPSCLAQGSEPRAMDSAHGNATSMVLDDALYWVRSLEDRAELVTALP